MRKQNKNRKQKKNNKNSNKGYTLARQSVYSSYQNPRTTFLDPHVYMVLHYAQDVGQTVASGVASQQTFNLNSIFDPDRTGTGTQPYAFDEVIRNYNRYRVLHVRYQMIFSPTTATFKAYVIPTNGLIAVAPTTAQTFMDNVMNPRCKTITQGLNAEAKSISGNIRLNDLNGCTITEYLGDDRFEAQVSTSPSEIMTLQVGFYNPSAGSLGINFTANLWFYVDLHDPILLGPS